MFDLNEMELEFAQHLATWFIGMGGETSAESLAKLHGLTEEQVRTWAFKRRFNETFVEDVFALEVLPFLWVDFADESRVCHAFLTILQQRIDAGDDKALTWVVDCDHSLERWMAQYSAPNVGQ